VSTLDQRIAGIVGTRLSVMERALGEVSLKFDLKSSNISQSLNSMATRIANLRHPVHFIDSAYLTNREQAEFLTKIIPHFSKLKSQSHLLFRATRDGFSAEAFHRLCDGKGPTLSLFKCKNGRLCGGFTAVSWGTGGA